MSYFAPNALAQANGYQHGRIEGERVGFRKGQEQGYDAGHALGYDKGWNACVQMAK
jgi:flagellar biosynthesis/type III secretory pathway protein FliH